MRICLFDWNAGGHHNFYVQAFAEALTPGADVVVAAPDPVIQELDRLAVDVHSLGDPRPRPGDGPGLDKATLARREIELLGDVVSSTAPDHVIVLFADPILRWLVGTPRFPCGMSIFVMFATAQLPRSYALPLSPKERAQALVKEINLKRWRRRRDSHVLFGLDAEAIRRWSQHRGAPVRWLAEPRLAIEPPRLPPKERNGCFMFGYIDERKGVDRLATALSHGCEGLPLTIFGAVAPEFRDKFDSHLETMELAGVHVETDQHRVPYDKAMDQMARSRCALLSFGWRKASGSRVLIEAAAARTPVIIGNDNVVGKLVEQYELGLTPNPDDPRAIRQAILELSLDPEAPLHYEDNLRRYAEEVHGNRFVATIRDTFGLSQR